MKSGVSKELSELREKALTESMRGIEQELAITKGYLELFNILVNTKFKVRGNRSYLPKDHSPKRKPWTRTGYLSLKAKQCLPGVKEKKEKGKDR